MGRPAVLLLLCSVLVTGLASGGTWVIQPDGGGDAPTIQAGIDSAGAGDTVLVMSGTYYEKDITLKSSVYLTSETGTADCVTIDAAHTGRVFYSYQVGSTEIVGFTVLDGSARGATGGGMWCRESDLKLTNCIFTSCYAEYGGGAVSIWHCSPVFSDCVFHDNYYLDDEGMGMGGGVSAGDGSPEFNYCTFSDNEAPLGSAGAFGGDECTPTFNGCLFTGNRGFGAGIALWGDCFAYVNGCTFTENRSLGGGGCVYLGMTSSAALDRCIIVWTAGGNGVNCDGPDPVLTCCDVYGNEWGDWVGCIADQYGIEGNISEGPQFCDPDNGEFTLRAGSPCLDADTCGTIGAYGLGCTFAIKSITDVICDQGGQVTLTWYRNRFDSTGVDTAIDYYSIWRRIDAPLAGNGARAASVAQTFADPPGTWEYVDSIAASGAYTYTATCPTVCDSTGAGICWSVYFVRAHCSIPPLEFDTAPDSGYSTDDVHFDIWTDVTTATLGDVYLGHGFAWVDYDNDGDLDIFITNRTSEDRLYRNDSLTAEGFVDATPLILADAGDCRGAAWGDYDNDGDLDLYVTRNGPNKLYRNDGGETFTNVTAYPLSDGGIGQTASWADYDNDGDVDLFLVNNGTNHLFRNDGGGVFTDVTTGHIGNPSHGMGCGWADYDDDGDLDLYVANYDAANLLLENQGGGAFANATTSPIQIPGPSVGVAWGDYDNDGDLDLYIANEGGNRLVRNDGGVFTNVTEYPLNNSDKGRSAAWADQDLDGDLDLYLVNYDGTNRLFRNVDGDSFVICTGCGPYPLEDQGKGFSTGWGDYDKDGDLDIYLVKDACNRLSRNDLDLGYHWLEVRLVGVVSNSYGQGARVRIVTGGTSQMREIAGASGYLSQGPLTAMFGLGTATTVDTIEVTWPASGNTQIVTGVACDQSLEIIEEDLSGLSDDTQAPKVFRLHPNRPNPFSRVTAIRYDLPEPAHVDLAIYDVSGRLVRKLIDHHLTEPGRHTAHWDGRNAGGRLAGPGIYFCRLSAGSHRQIKRMVLLK